MMNPHLNIPVVKIGASLQDSKAVVVAVHGRNQSAETMIELIDRFRTEDVHYVVPQAFENSWYPNGFMEDLSKNEPYLSYSLETYQKWLDDLFKEGIDPKKVILLGFSQGACLTAEYAVRTPKRYGGMILFTGGFIGPEGMDREAKGSFEGTPVFLGSSDIDDWVPEHRVHETEKLMKEMNADTNCRIYKGMEHIINDDEVKHAINIIEKVKRA